MDNKSLGNFGESLATEFLKNNGYEILDRNYRRMGTEIDIIAKKDFLIVVVEVKTRRSRKFGNAYEAVDERKINNIIQTISYYILEKNLYDYQIRFDIIEVYSNEKVINHIENAF